MTHRSRQLRVSALARIEGEGALRVVVQDGQVLAAELQIYEPPRFFEAFLRGRQHTEVTDITSRICGICPVAYQTSAWNAIEDACGVTASDAVTALRRLLYCGEWISSHALHIYMLHAPDFLGYPDVIALARDHRDLVERGLRLKKAGNAILEAVGGRAIHPVNTRVGGFYRAPAKAELVPLAEQLRHALGDALATVTWVAGFDFPDVNLDHELLALHDPGRYAIEDGQVASASGLAFPAAEFSRHVAEYQVPHSTALHARLDGRVYLTGPLARYTINSAQLSPVARQAAAGPASAPPAATRSAASWSARSRPSTPLRRRCGSSMSTSGPSHRLPRCRRSPALATASARPRAACSTTATSSPVTAASSRPPSSPRHRRTRPRSRPTCVTSCRPACTSTTPRSPRYASGLSATTTRASPAPPTSSISA